MSDTIKNCDKCDMSGPSKCCDKCDKSKKCDTHDTSKCCDMSAGWFAGVCGQ